MPDVPNPNRAPPRPETPARVLALGDSYTIGEAVGEEERWPAQLAAMLREDGWKVAPPEFVARTGWTTDELAEGIDRARPEGPYEFVTLLIGVNNQFRGRSETEYREQFRELLKRAAGCARDRDPKRVVALSIPDWGAMPFGQRYDRAKVAREIDRFNAIGKDEAEKAGARWVDVTPLSREAPKRPELAARDGLHPSGAQYAEWARLALPEARKALEGAAK
ncbi:MAG: SGNH/GDSL hydrolase family protein [Planctomycetota bacterium]|nr:SGNH/GDSL hydrolase family protein [Planctomycetota bacterium]